MCINSLIGCFKLVYMYIVCLKMYKFVVCFKNDLNELELDFNFLII